MKYQLGDVEFNLERHRHWLPRALETDPAFIGFPEFSLTGWAEEPYQALRLDCPALREVEGWARKHRVWIGVGLVERHGKVRHNTVVIFGPRGRVGFMRKTNLGRRELLNYTPGREFPVFDVAGCRMAVNTCADASVYEMFHIFSLRGAEVIFAPHANSLHSYGNCPAGWFRWRMEEWPRWVARTRMYVLGVNCAGLFEGRTPADEPTKYCGGGMVMDWTGKPVVRAPVRAKRECLFTAELDLAALREARAKQDDTFQKGIIYSHLFRERVRHRLVP